MEKTHDFWNETEEEFCYLMDNCPAFQEWFSKIPDREIEIKAKTPKEMSDRAAYNATAKKYADKFR